MIVIPSIDIQNGKCVKLVQGKEGTGLFVSEDPVNIAKQWEEQGAEWLHVIDLDAAFGKGNNLDIIEKIISVLKIPIEVGGGIRDEETATKLIKCGARKIIVGTKAIIDPDFLPNLSRKIEKDSIIVAVDSKNRKVVIRRWKEKTNIDPIEFANRIKNHCSSILFTSVEKEGMLEGLDFEYIEKFKNSVGAPIIISGGIGSLEDIKKLKNLNIYAAVIGMAFYKKAFSLKDAMKYIENSS